MIISTGSRVCAGCTFSVRSVVYLLRSTDAQGGGGGEHWNFVLIILDVGEDGG